jgi:signal transduction histidine kinase
MRADTKGYQLIYEEVKAVKLFLITFYLIFYAYDFYYYFLLPKLTGGKMGFPEGGLGYWHYLFILLLLPIAIYFLKKRNPYGIKYIYFFSITFLDILNNILIYFGETEKFASGNGVEIVLILFIPIFVNKKYFWVLSIGMILKYLLYGLLFTQINVTAPIVIFVILSISSYMLLNRFSSYVDALKIVHEELRQKEKLVLIGQMATAIGHEIRNPLAALRGFTQLQQENHPENNEYYPIMIQEIDRLNLIVNDLMILGKPKSVEFKRNNLKEILAYVLSVTEQQAATQGVLIESTFKDRFTKIDCDQNQMKQVFMNLLKNAIESMPEGGTVKIGSQAINSKQILITISDEGTGISEEELFKLGEPFYTTKSDGTGLGLMVSHQIIKDHNGTILFESNQGKGTSVKIVLPINQEIQL